MIPANAIEILMGKSIISWERVINRFAWRVCISTFDKDVYKLGFFERLTVPEEPDKPLTQENKSFIEEILKLTLLESMLQKLSYTEESIPC